MGERCESVDAYDALSDKGESHVTRVTSDKAYFVRFTIEPSTMAAPTHNRVPSNTSTLTVGSEGFSEDVRANIAGPTSTPALVRKARSHLRGFAMDPNRLIRHPTTLIDLDPHAIINAMLDCAPTEDGQRYVACAVISCQEHTNLLVVLANTWLRYFLLAFPKLKAIRTPETKLLERDGYRCPLTGVYEISRIAPSVEGPKATLEAARILKRAVAIFDNKQEKSAIATWDII
ncbi:hypothetical protein K439DRAFT_1620679 [Ramaria rubella]|nr:hypothetical protein K439DRAFT_1620679 [Ramaria rubella]